MKKLNHRIKSVLVLILSLSLFGCTEKPVLTEFLSSNQDQYRVEYQGNLLESSGNKETDPIAEACNEIYSTMLDRVMDVLKSVELKEKSSLSASEDQLIFMIKNQKRDEILYFYSTGEAKFISGGNPRFFEVDNSKLIEILEGYGKDIQKVIKEFKESTN